MHQLVNSLPAVIAAAGDTAEVLEAACLSAWKTTTGEALSRRARASEFEDHKLVVLVEDAIWQRQLEQMRVQLVARVNSLLGQPLVKRIEFQINSEAFASNESDRNTRSNVAPIPVELLSAAAQIEDVALRRAFLGAASTCLERLESQS